jgi:hypothetical protein
MALNTVRGKIKRGPQPLGQKGETPNGDKDRLRVDGTGSDSQSCAQGAGILPGGRCCDRDEQGDAMQEIAELEQRLAAALSRIGKDLERLSLAPAQDPRSGSDAEALARARADLEDEKTANAQLVERLRVVKEKDLLVRSELESKIERLTRQLDTQGLELQRMRKTAVQLREQLREVREAQSQDIDPHMINKAMMAELEALRATRLTEMAEMDELIAELSPLIEEAVPHA